MCGCREALRPRQLSHQGRWDMSTRLPSPCFLHAAGWVELKMKSCSPCCHCCSRCRALPYKERPVAVPGGGQQQRPGPSAGNPPSLTAGTFDAQHRMRLSEQIRMKLHPNSSHISKPNIISRLLNTSSQPRPCSKLQLSLVELRSELSKMSPFSSDTQGTHIHCVM